MAVRLPKNSRSTACIVLTFMCGLSPGNELVQAPPSDDASTRLVDVTEGSLQDGWGKEAVRTLSMYFTADASQPDVTCALNRLRGSEHIHFSCTICGNRRMS